MTIAPATAETGYRQAITRIPSSRLLTGLVRAIASITMHLTVNVMPRLVCCVGVQMAHPFASQLRCEDPSLVPYSGVYPGVAEVYEKVQGHEHDRGDKNKVLYHRDVS